MVKMAELLYHPRIPWLLPKKDINFCPVYIIVYLGIYFSSLLYVP